MHKSFTKTTARRGFTLVEVLIAAFVLTTGLVGSLSALMQAFDLIDNARNKTLAGQIVQSDLETTRLFSYANLPAGGTITLSPEIVALGKGFAAQRTVSDVAGCTDANGNVTMRSVSVEVRWRDFRGRSHTYTYTTYYGKGGLSDYFVTNRPPIY